MVDIVLICCGAVTNDSTGNLLIFLKRVRRTDCNLSVGCEMFDKEAFNKDDGRLGSYCEIESSCWYCWMLVYVCDDLV